MTNNQYLFDGQTNGTTATAALTGGSSVTITGSGSAITFDSAFGVRSTSGLKFVATASTTGCVARFTGTAGANYAFEGVITTPAANPSSNLTLVAFRSASGRNMSLQWSTAGRLFVLDSGSTQVGDVAAAGLLANATQYRVAVLMFANATTAASGTVKVNVYTPTGTTPISGAQLTSTAGNFTVNPFSVLELGSSAAVAGTWGWDDVQWADGATTELGQIVVASSSVRPSSVIANGGSFTNQGGAADLAAALADESDTTYAQSPDNPSAAYIEYGFPTLASGDVTVKTRNKATAGSPASQTLIELRQGSTVISSRTVTLTTSYVDHTWTTSSAETSAITNRSDLRVRLTDSLS